MIAGRSFTSEYPWLYYLPELAIDNAMPLGCEKKSRQRVRAIGARESSKTTNGGRPESPSFTRDLCNQSTRNGAERRTQSTCLTAV